MLLSTRARTPPVIAGAGRSLSYSETGRMTADHHEDTEVLELDGGAIRARWEADPTFGYALLKRFSSLISERLHFAQEDNG
jgi:hypothetical protein